MNNATLINQSSGSVDYYTPPHIIKAVHKCMGRIDLDPASCAKANETVRAYEYFTKENNGLSQSWYRCVSTKVFMNHPFGRGENEKWIKRVIKEYVERGIVEACVLTYACTSEKWFQPLFNYPMCFLYPRTNYLGVDGKPVKGVTKGSVVTYLGDNVTNFVNAFMDLGRVKI